MSTPGRLIERSDHLLDLNASIPDAVAAQLDQRRSPLDLRSKDIDIEIIVLEGIENFLEF